MSGNARGRDRCGVAVAGGTAALAVVWLAGCAISFDGFELARDDAGGAATAGATGTSSATGVTGANGGTSTTSATGGSGATGSVTSATTAPTGSGSASGTGTVTGSDGGGNVGTGTSGSTSTGATTGIGATTATTATSGASGGGTTTTTGASDGGNTTTTTGSSGSPTTATTTSGNTTTGSTTAGTTGTTTGSTTTGSTTTGSTTTGSTTTGSTTTGGTTSAGCPTEGAPMIEVPIPTGAPGAPGFTCIDRTEVTNQQYAAFLAKTPDLNTQPAFCTWNLTFAPQSSPGADNCDNVAVIYDTTNHPNNPVACVDWCDAYAYCRSVGKRLCGAYGGGAVPSGSGANAKVDEWYASCSAAGTKTYPYSSQYNGMSCNDLDLGHTGSVPAQFAVNCIGGYDGIFDMSGNVAEWQDSCSGTSGIGDSCSYRGGYWNSYNTAIASVSAMCSAVPTTLRSRLSREIGFRCCYDGK